MPNPGNFDLLHRDVRGMVHPADSSSCLHSSSAIPAAIIVGLRQTGHGRRNIFGFGKPSWLVAGFHRSSSSVDLFQMNMEGHEPAGGVMAGS